MKEKKEIPMDPAQRIDRISSCEFAVGNGMRIEASDEDEVRVSMELDGKLNGFGTGHGGAIFALADQAFALIVNKGPYPQVAMSARIRYLKPATGSLVAIARKVKEDEKTSVCAVEVLQAGEKIAEFEGIGYKLKRR